MREHLFKAKRTDNGKWIQGYLFKCWSQAWILWGATNGVPNMVEVDPATVCEYAGLTDKNGVKIFEGDRCRVSRPCVLAYGKIVFHKGCFWFVDDGSDSMLRLCDMSLNGFDIEVCALPEKVDSKKLAKTD